MLISRVVSEKVMCVVVREGYPEANCANVILLKIGDKIDANFLAQQLKTQRLQRYLMGRKVGSAQSVVNTKILKACPVFWPSKAIRQKATLEMDAIVNAKESCLQDLLNAHLLFNALLQKAFKGELT